jgi:hypothetical protein
MHFPPPAKFTMSKSSHAPLTPFLKDVRRPVLQVDKCLGNFLLVVLSHFAFELAE